MKKSILIIFKKLLLFLIAFLQIGFLTTTANAASTKPTVYIAGDSTVATYDPSVSSKVGWGQVIPTYFTSDLIFENHAIGGRSSKSFIDEGRLAEILKKIKPNDYLFIQFGHNDQKKNDPARYTEPYTTYKQYLKQYIDGARAKKAIPVLITPVARLNYKNGKFNNDFVDYDAAMKQVAAKEKVKIIDLTTKSINYFTSIGYNETYKLFMISLDGTDRTHFTKQGGIQIAKLVSQGVKENNLPISKYVK
ncbi:putative rhamnogalacturonan acetylesterase YesY [Clostridium puniceum]|uniref:Putative rhamnogalacturonan acetylesterase YesY n=1 Tax=Clostridium puniceum TaxID=29367 RepID=A0A1S8TEQ1_9CLOT|nr:rhamnogalacturonan acetylesterase [Clostridium puniceum]OOM76280.1 putative rhamnogalacturonan acetylesterase YesY [Clostridium puniceum]